MYVEALVHVLLCECVIVNDFHDNVMYIENEMQILRLILYWLDLMLIFFSLGRYKMLKRMKK